jgi:transcriptional regulator with XRE-family HTH domain
MRDTTIKTFEALGRAIRTQRLVRGLSQAVLAERIGVERKWVVRLEAGNHAAEIANVMKAIEVLGLELKLTDPGRRPARPSTPQLTPSINEVFDRLDRGMKR